MYNKYTAKLYFKDQKFIKSEANDLNTLIVHSIVLLDNNQDYLLGTIIDNNTGKIIHRCQKLSC